MPRQKTEVKLGREWTFRIEIHVAGVLKGYLWAAKDGIWWQRARAKRPKKKSWAQFDDWMNCIE